MVQSNIIVRKATLDDIKYAKEASAVVNQAYRSKGGWTTEEDFVAGERCTEEQMQSFIRESGNPHTLLFAVEHPHKIVGTVQIQTSPEHPSMAEVALFSVSPYEQSRGIGSQLIRAALTEMKEMGMTHAMLHVLEIRQELLKWYKKLGFEETGESVPYVWPEKLKINGLHLLILKKALA
ncbi:hypothetical protein G6F37_003209 [Rhizopus arrhizus]|nr:hypothetical protein G6F38_003351 [Rhizopus arrhizus]KAG1161301.1 hypothetical protein G6F37_003209 [Rhizopus arrhizus]